jgi:hypothetical protein
VGKRKWSGVSGERRGRGLGGDLKGKSDGAVAREDCVILHVFLDVLINTLCFLYFWIVNIPSRKTWVKIALRSFFGINILENDLRGTSERGWAMYGE